MTPVELLMVTQLGTDPEPATSEYALVGAFAPPVAATQVCSTVKVPVSDPLTVLVVAEPQVFRIKDF